MATASASYARPPRPCRTPDLSLPRGAHRARIHAHSGAGRHVAATPARPAKPEPGSRPGIACPRPGARGLRRAADGPRWLVHRQRVLSERAALTPEEAEAGSVALVARAVRSWCARPVAGAARTVRARSRQCRKGHLSDAARCRWRPAGTAVAFARAFRRPARCEPPPPGRGRAGGLSRRRQNRVRGRPAALLPSEFPLPDRRLPQRALGQPLRCPGGVAVRRYRQRHAPAGARAHRRESARTRPAQAGDGRSCLRHRTFPAHGARCLSAHEDDRRGPVPCLPARGRRAPEGLLPGASRGRQLRTHTAAHAQSGHRHLDLPVPRAAARGAPRRRRRIRARPAPRRHPGVHGFAPDRRHPRVRPDTGEFPRPFPRTLLRQLHPRRSRRDLQRGRLVPVSHVPAFLSKVSVYRKPA